MIYSTESCGATITLPHIEYQLHHRFKVLMLINSLTDRNQPLLLVKKTPVIVGQISIIYN